MSSWMEYFDYDRTCKAKLQLQKITDVSKMFRRAKAFINDGIEINFGGCKIFPEMDNAYVNRQIKNRLVLAEAGAQAAQRIGRPDDDGIAHLGSRLAGLFEGGRRMGPDCFHADLVQPLHEQFPVFRIDDGFNRGSHGQRSLEGYRPWGHKESDMTG